MELKTLLKVQFSAFNPWYSWPSEDPIRYSHEHTNIRFTPRLNCMYGYIFFLWVVFPFFLICWLISYKVIVTFFS